MAQTSLLVSEGFWPTNLPQLQAIRTVRDDFDMMASLLGKA